MANEVHERAGSRGGCGVRACESHPSRMALLLQGVAISRCRHPILRAMQPTGSPAPSPIAAEPPPVGGHPRAAARPRPPLDAPAPRPDRGPVAERRPRDGRGARRALPGRWTRRRRRPRSTGPSTSSRSWGSCATRTAPTAARSSTSSRRPTTGTCTACGCRETWEIGAGEAAALVARSARSAASRWTSRTCPIAGCAATAGLGGAGRSRPLATGDTAGPPAGTAGRASAGTAGRPDEPRRYRAEPSTASDSAGQASPRPGSERPVREARERQARDRVDPQERPAAARSARTSPASCGVPVQCGDLPSADLEAQPPVAAGPGARTPAARRAGPGTRRSSPRPRAAAGRTRGAQQLARERGEVGGRPHEALATGGPRGASRSSRAGRAPSPAASSANGRPAARRQHGAERVEPRVGVDPRPPGRRDTDAAVEREYPPACASRCRTVAPGGPAGVVEREHPALRPDQDGARRDAAW